MKVLVTGGAGFIGSHIVDAFIKKEYEVVVVDDLSTGYKDNLNRNAVLYQMNIQDDALESVFEREKPDYICHLAAQKDVRFSVTNPVADARINILGTINILQNCVKHKVKKIVFASTGGAIYGEQDVFPAPESHPARPISPYGITKLVAEHYMYYYKMIYGLDYISLRYANVYGPRQDPHGEAGVVAIFIQKMLKGQRPVINGDGTQTRDFVYVGDVARSNVLAVEASTHESIFNIGTGIESSINEVYGLLRDEINPHLEAEYAPAKTGEQKRSVIDCTKAEKILHWKAELELQEGLKETCEFFRTILV